jgi:hypothetical protein
MIRSMETIVADLQRAVEELLGRASGPFHLRLLIQPTVSALLSIRAGLEDARRGRPPFLWTFLTDPEERRRLMRSAWKDIGKIFVVALALDVLYQMVALRAFHLLQTLIVATALAIVPYVLLRGPATHLAQKRNKPTS